MTPQRPAKSVNLRGLSPAPVAALVALSVGLVACGSDPFAFPWQLSPDTVLLYSLARPELNLEAAYNFNNRRKVRVETATATGTWDVAVDTRGVQIVLLPPGALGVSSKASVAALLLERGADQAIVDDEGCSPLHRATMHPAVVGVLESHREKNREAAATRAVGTEVGVRDRWCIIHYIRALQHRAKN